MLRKLILKHKRPGMSVPHTVDRYLSVFEKAGVTGTISKNVFPRSIKATRAGHGDKGVIRIGLAPISRHKTKNWGFNNIAELINLLRAKNNIEIHLFGGPEDQSILNSLSGSDVFNHAGLLNLKEELLLMQSMDLFLSMDSANMHLASLAGVPTLSIWGATDPCLGFAPLFQPDGYSLRADQAEVTCRPCSVYGEVPCKRFDAPMICMKSIKPQMVIEKINNFLQADHNSEGL